MEQNYKVDSGGEANNDDIDQLLFDAFPTSDNKEHNDDEGANRSS